MIYPLDLLKPNTYIKLNTKTQNIFCCVNESLTTFYTLWQGGQEKRRRKKSFLFKVYNKVERYQKNFWVLVFSFMYLVSVDSMDWSLVVEITKVLKYKEKSWEIFTSSKTSLSPSSAASSMVWLKIMVFFTPS